MVCEGLATVNDIEADPHQRVFKGETVCIRLVEPPDKLLEAEPAPLDIVWEDPWLMVLNKAVGVVAHPVGDFQDSTLCNAIQAHLDSKTRAPGILRPGIVHRLDRMTSGLIVIAKEHLSHRVLSLDFQAGRPQKSYLALVEGVPDFNSRLIDLPIGIRAGENSVLMSTDSNARNRKKARTDATVLKRFGEYSLVECTLHTGRHHQIRVHMAAIGHPIVGDDFYAANGAVRQSARFDGGSPTDDRHALHASRLSFTHPILNHQMTFTTEPGKDFWALVSNAGLNRTK